jgi:hypothetical protein
MIGKKINQLATELAPVSTDLTIIGDPDSGVSKKITLAQLGAIFSGAVSFYTNLAGFPAVGDINVIYCAKDTQKLYLWSGSAYTEVFPSQALLDTYQLRSEKGVSNGYASLDSGGKVPISQLPSSIMEYKGTWNAATNTPTLANGTGDTGDVYICNVAGTVNFGAGPITFAVGDYVIYSGTIWQRSSGAVGTVTSVALTVGGDAISVSGSPLTTSGTLALAFSGTSAQYINGAGNLITFPTSLISGSGASGQVTFFNGANSVTGTNNFFWDATNNRLGIGTTTPQRSIEIYNTTADNHLRLSGNAPSVSMGEAVTGSIYQAKFGLVTTNGQFVSAGVAGDFVIISQTGATIIGTSSTEKMRVNTSGNVSINNTNNTYKLDVTGTGRFTGQLRLESTITDGTNTYTLPSATGTLALTSQIPSVTGYVPYTGATANVDLGTHTLIAAKGTFSSSGSGDTVGITHSSGSGIALNITKGGSGEGLYINKTSGSGNAATIIGTLNATTLVKSGGTSSQFLKADGSVDSTSYGTGSVTSVGLSSATSGVTIGSTPITTSGTITLAIATASGSQQGLLSSTDWTTFNGKQAALNGTGFVKISGTTISYDNSTYLTTSAASSTYLPLAGGTLTGALGGTSATFSSRVNVNAAPDDADIAMSIKAPSGGGKFILFGRNSANTAVFNIADTGAATFSSSVTANGLVVLGSNSSSTPYALGSSTPRFQLMNGGVYGLAGDVLTNGNTYLQSQRTDGNTTAYNLLLQPLGGNVGIGTSSPSNKLDILSAVSATPITNGVIRIVGTGTNPATGAGGGILLAQQNSAGSYINYASITGRRVNNAANDIVDLDFNTGSPSDAVPLATRMTITGNAGNVGIGTTSPSQKLDVNGKIRATDDLILAQTNPVIAYDNGTTGALRFASDGGNTERMRITSGGEVCINRTSSLLSSVLSIDQFGSGTSNIALNHFYTGNKYLDFGWYGTSIGSITNTNGTSVLYNTTSDYRLKQDLKQFNGLDLLNKIKTYDYEWKSDGSRMYGVIAHELQSVINYAVTGVKDGKEMQGVDYSKIVPVLIKAIQELNDKIK